MEANFRQALKWVLQSEGGNDDDPADHGGRTSRGITQREDNAYRHMAGLPLIDVWQEKQEIIEDIYHKSYWMPYCPTMPPGVDYIFFDCSVLSGPGRAVKDLQKALSHLGHDLHVDGHIGMVTSAALVQAAKYDLGKLIDAMSVARQDFYNAIVAHNPSQRKFIRGWSNRVHSARVNAHTLAVAHVTS